MTTHLHTFGRSSSDDSGQLKVAVRPPEPVLRKGLIIDLDHYDIDFTKRVCDLFEISEYHDGESSRELRDWISFSVREIVDLFSMNPGTLSGTLNMGADREVMSKLGMTEEKFGLDVLDDFDHLYKTLATNISYTLSRKLDRYISQAYYDGYSDIMCEARKYRPNMVLLDVRAIKLIK